MHVQDVPPEFPPEGVFSTVEEAIASLPDEPVDEPMADTAMLSEDDDDNHLMIPELIKQTLSL